MISYYAVNILVDILFLYCSFQTKMQSTTKLQKIIRESKDACAESELQSRMQPLKDLLTKNIDHLHNVVEPSVFVLICRFFWDHMGQVRSLLYTSWFLIRQSFSLKI